MTPGSENPAGGAKASVDAPPPGTILAGKYKVEKLIGAGGMGVVVSALHVQLNKRVAVKLLHPRAAAQTNPALRFVREARAAAALRSEHVAQVTDVDQLESGAPFMVMEFLSGSSLSKVIRQRAPMVIEEAVDFTLQACEAIAEAHGLGIVHRDLKPGNLFLTKRSDGSPLIKVLDFGISKMVGPEDEEQDLTATNMILGSPQYASPEQLRSLKTTDSRTDIWALGVILYYMLSGRRPFEAETLSALFVAISTDQPPSLGSLRPGLPPELEAIVMHCLEKNREKRVQNVQTLIQALRPFGPSASHSRAPVSAEMVPSVQPSEPVTGPSADPRPLPLGVGTRADVATSGTKRAWEGAPAPPRGTPMWLVQIAAALGAAAMLVIVYVKLGRDTAKPPDASQVESVPDQGRTTASVAEPRPAPPPPKDVASAGVGTPLPEEPFVPPPVGVAPGARTADRPPVMAGTGGAGQFGVSRAKIKLTNRAGGGVVVGELAAGELVVVTQEYGDWFRISHAGTGQLIMGWTPKATIRLQ